MGAVIAALGRWLLLGILWGVLGRLFMRLVATNPEFSWAGTSMFVAMGAIVFVLTGLSATAMTRGWSRWWRLAALPALFIFVGQGLALLPAAVGTFLAVRVRNVWVRSVALAAGLVGNYLLLRATVDFNWLQPRTLVLGHVLAVVAGAWLGAQFALALRPRATRRPLGAEGAPSRQQAATSRRVTA